MPVKFWHTNLRFWFLLSYLITTVCITNIVCILKPRKLYIKVSSMKYIQYTRTMYLQKQFFSHYVLLRIAMQDYLKRDAELPEALHIGIVWQNLIWWHLSFKEFTYRIVASTNTCYYSENQIFYSLE